MEVRDVVYSVLYCEHVGTRVGVDIIVIAEHSFIMDQEMLHYKCT